MTKTTGSLDARVALVTGGTSGIGEATAHALARSGARVVLTGRRVDRGEAVASAICQAGGEAAFHAGDVREAADCDGMVDAALQRWGRLDIAFNNAGIFDAPAPIDEYTDEAWQEMLDANLSSVFRCMRAEIRAMKSTGGGSIVNNASTVAHRGSGFASPGYVVAKHGVLGLTRQAAVNSIGNRIRVNAVSPGPTRTEISDPLVAQGPEAVRAVLAPLNPTGEYVSVEQVAEAVVYLCSDAASMINGQDIVLDGGQLASL
jgi:NAD(P)-dependent dehydrogenase (short-subunit alcohol dehydrogenase family)